MLLGTIRIRASMLKWKKQQYSGVLYTRKNYWSHSTKNLKSNKSMELVHDCTIKIWEIWKIWKYFLFTSGQLR